MSIEIFDGWEEASTSDDFFKQAEVSDDAGDESPVSPDSDEEGEENEEEKPSSKNKKKVDVDLFAGADDESVDDPHEPDAKEPTIEDENLGSNISILNTLKNKGLIDFELEEDEELTEELAETLIEDKLEETIEAKIGEKLSSLPDDVKDLIKYTLNGGSLEDYFDSENDITISPDLDLTNTKNQEAVMRLALSDEYDTEEIEAQIEFLKDSGKLESLAKKRFEKIIEAEKKEKAEKIKAQEEFYKKQKETLRKDKKEIADTLSRVSTIGAISFTKEDKKDLPSFIKDRTIQTNTGNMITELQKALYIDIPNNKEAMLQLAALVKNRNEDGTFNLDKIVKKVKSNITKEVKDNLRRKKSIPGSTGGSSPQRVDKPLADYFK